MRLSYMLSCVLFLVSLCVANVTFGFVCPPTVPVQGAALPHNPSPIFPADNWWNQNIQSAPVDPNSQTYINFIGGTRNLHPDFGGEVSPGSVAMYGMPYAIVGGSQPLQAVTFQYWSESDGVDYTTGQGFPFYPIPLEAITQAHWVEGGASPLHQQAERMFSRCNNKRRQGILATMPSRESPEQGPSVTNCSSKPAPPISLFFQYVIFQIGVGHAWCAYSCPKR